MLLRRLSTTTNVDVAVQLLKAALRKATLFTENAGSGRAARQGLSGRATLGCARAVQVSSRSHAVLQLKVECKPRFENTKKMTVGKLSLIDLAVCGAQAGCGLG